MGFDATSMEVSIAIIMIPCRHSSFDERGDENYQENCHETVMKARDSA